ncbi:MAG: hypothetical protein SPI65_02130 [Peptoniphilus sp.]|nr:hypothetical protein [Peptoniphilus sp.]MDD7363119.1 hypothetical protein [Bacillota bacterium]MDY6044359.1 hypothetical protein [Peptoniphilus sp.]
MKLSKFTKNLIKLAAFTQGLKLLTRKPVRKASGGLLKRYLAWKLYRRR